MYGVTAVSREDCSKTSYIIAEGDNYNCACPQCGDRFLDERFSLKFVEVVTCKSCSFKRQILRDKMLNGRRVTPAQRQAAELAKM